MDQTHMFWNHLWSAAQPRMGLSLQIPGMQMQTKPILLPATMNFGEPMTHTSPSSERSLSPKSVERMAKMGDRKRPGSQESAQKRPRGRPRIYHTSIKQEGEDDGGPKDEPTEQQGAGFDELTEGPDGTKRRKYASFLAKNDPKYLDMRRANNEAVKRNRDKAKRLQLLKDQELERLNERLNSLEAELLAEKDMTKRLTAQLETCKGLIETHLSRATLA
ncbi:unnamed protein product, partial [Mesorhabditis spiculigera]